MRRSYLPVILRAAHPLSLVAGVLLYALGGGIASYLGNTINWTVYWLGQGFVTTLQLSSFFLRAYFDLIGQPPFRREPENVADGAEEKPKSPPRVAYLQLAVTALTVGAVLTVLLVSIQVMPPSAWLILIISLVVALSYATPPLRLVYSGYGELVLAILHANLFPALAFLLQAGSFHRLLAMLTFPLTFLFLAVKLAGSLRSYMDDIRKEHSTMIVRLGWERGMNLHNILIVMAYVLLALSVIAGLPWRLAFPAFLSLPIALFQVWQINGIMNGGKPRWSLLSITSIATLAFAIYFLNLALWTG